MDDDQDKSAGVKGADDDRSAEDEFSPPGKVLLDLERAGRQADLTDFLKARLLNAAAINIAGDLVVRDKVHRDGLSSSESVPQLLPKNALARYQRFSAPRCLDDIRAFLIKHSFVVLAGRAGWGKYTLGVNLLAELREQLHTLEPQTDLRTLAGRLSDGGGYLLDGIATRRLRELTAVDLDRLVDQLETSKALLVVTVVGDVGDVHPSVRGLMPELGDPPDLRDVLISQLRGLTSETEVQKLIADDTVLNQLSQCKTSSMAYQLALELTDRAASASPAELSARQAGQQRTAVEMWLGECRDEYWPYLFSTAVLDGLRRDLIVKGGADIARTGKVDPLSSPERLDLFETLRTESWMGEWRTSYGMVHAERVRFHQWEHQPWVLDLVWQHGAHLRDPMMRWLRHLGKHDEQKVRFAAGAAVGQLMVNEFPLFVPLVYEWADSKEEAPREAAVAAVMVAAGDDMLRQVFQQMVTRWAVSSSVAQKWTAARVCGRALGGFFPDLAIMLLRMLVRRRSDLLLACSQSIVELAEDADEPLFAKLLSTVHNWANQADEDLRTAAVFVFLQLCVDLSDATSALPRLLEPGDGADEQVKDLWRIAIVHPDLHKPAAAAIQLWARSCETHPDAPAQLARMFGGVPQWSRHRTILHTMATSWASGIPAYPRSADAVMSALVARGEGELR